MNDPSVLQMSNPGRPPGPYLREAILSSVRFWERGRIVYNLVLTGLVLGLVGHDWAHFRPVLVFPDFLLALAYMLFLAMLANLCYCAAYPVDLALQLSPAPKLLRRGRTLLWWAGMIFAFVLAWYWVVDEIYPGVQ